MKNNTLFTVVVASVLSLSCFSGAALAANPFLVSQASVESMGANGGRAAYDASKSVTLAESLVQLRQCHMGESEAELFSVDEGFETIEAVDHYNQSAAEDFDFDLSEVQVIK